MTKIKVGDRVHVEFDGVVQYISPTGDGYMDVDGENGPLTSMHVDYCTLLSPPIKVGDVVSERNIEQLPSGLVVAGASEVAMLANALVWFIDGATPPFTGAELLRRAVTYRVLRIGGA